MATSMDKYYNPDDLTEWIAKSPADMLQASVSNTRTTVESLISIGTQMLTNVSSGGDVTFATQPLLTLNQLFEIFSKHGVAVHKLVGVGYLYWKPPETRDAIQINEDFEFHIDITDDFDVKSFALQHEALTPLSMLLAISKGFIEHTNEIDFYLRLLAHPDVRDSIYFFNLKKTKTIPISMFIDGLIDFNHTINRIGQTGIAYVNSKRGV